MSSHTSRAMQKETPPPPPSQTQPAQIVSPARKAELAQPLLGGRGRKKRTEDGPDVQAELSHSPAALPDGEATEKPAAAFDAAPSEAMAQALLATDASTQSLQIAAAEPMRLQGGQTPAPSAPASAPPQAPPWLAAAWSSNQLPLTLAGGLIAALALRGGSSDPAPDTSTASDPDPSQSQATVQGAITLGPALSSHTLTVTAYDRSGQLLAQTPLSADGSYTLNITNGYTGPVLLRVTDSGEGKDYVDEATGEERELDGELRSVAVLDASGSATAHVTPLTELVLRMLGLPAGQSGAEGITLGNISAEQITAVKTKLALALGLDGIDLTTDRPDPIIDANGVIDLSRANAYGRLLAALSGMEAGEGHSTDQMLQTLLASIDLEAGTLSPDGLMDLVIGARLVAAKNSPAADALFGEVGQAMGLSAVEIDGIDSAWSTLITLADGQDNDGAGLSTVQLQALGVKRVDGGAKLDALNNVLDVKTSTVVQSRTKLQAWADTITVVLSKAAGEQATPTQDELEDLGLTDLTPGRTIDLVNKIATTSDDGRDVDSLAELQALVDVTAPTTSLSALTLGSDTGLSASDWITREAVQTLTARLSAPLLPDEQLLGSVDGGANWQNISRFVSGTTLSWTGATLVGASTIKLKVIDAALNEGPITPQAYVLDTAPPNLQITQTNATIAGDGAINAAERNVGVVLSGTSEANRDVSIATGSGAGVTVTASGTGAWSATVDSLPESGTVTFSVTSSDAAGNTATVSRTATVDTSAPTVDIDPVAEDDTVEVSEKADGVTISGTSTAEDGQTVTVDWGAVSLPAIIRAGAWSVTYRPEDIPKYGKDRIAASVLDLAGNPSAVAMRSVTVIPDDPNQGPLTLDFDPLANNGWINAAQAKAGWTVSGTTNAADGLQVQVFWPEAPPLFASINNGRWAVTFSPEDLPVHGNHFLTASIEDAQGQLIVLSTQQVAVDITAPDLQVTQTDDDIAGDGILNAAEYATGLQLSGTTEPGLDVIIAGPTEAKATADGAGAWSATIPAASLPPRGSVSLTITSSDWAGNTATVTRTATVDTTAPALTITQIEGQIAGDGMINAAERPAGVVLSGTSQANRDVSIATGSGAGVTVTASGTGAWSATVPAANLPESGTVTFSVTSSNAVGNTATVIRTAMVDTTAPNAPTLTSQLTNAARPLLVGTAEPGSSIVLTAGSASFSAITGDDGAWQVNTATAQSTGTFNLGGDGSKTVQITSTDAAGNSSNRIASITLDTLAPEATLRLAPHVTLAEPFERQATTQVMSLPEGRFLVYWTDQEERDIFAQIFDDDGSPSQDSPDSPDTVAFTVPPGDNVGNLHLVSLGAGKGWVVSWNLYLDDNSDTPTYIQVIANDGQAEDPLLLAAENMRYASEPKIAAVGNDGDFVVVWFALFEPEGQANGSYEIYVQRFSRDDSGRAIAEVPIVLPRYPQATHPQATHGEPQIAALGSEGDFVVVWWAEEAGEDEDYNSLIAQRFDEDGKAWGEPVFIEPDPGTSLDRDNHRIAALGTDGAFVLVYESYPMAGEGPSQSFMSHVNSAGLVSDALPLLAPGMDGVNAQSPVVSALSDNSFVVAWVLGEDEEETQQVCVQHFAVGPAEVITAGPVHKLPALSAYAEVSDLQVLPWGERFAMSWTTWDGETDRVLVQLFNAEGLPVGGAQQLRVSEAQHAYSPQMAVLTGGEPGGDLVLSWVSSFDQGDDDEDNDVQKVSVQRLDLAHPFGSGVTFSSSDSEQFAGASWLGERDTIDIALSFDEAVQVVGEPRLRLHIGNEWVWASHTSGSGSTDLVFSYTVQAGQSDPDGIMLGELDLSEGAITDAAGNAAVLPETGAVQLNTGYRVDTQAPTAWAGIQEAVSLQIYGGAFPDIGAAKIIASIEVPELGMTLPLMTLVVHGPDGPVAGLVVVTPDGRIGLTTTEEILVPIGASPYSDQAESLMIVDAWLDTALLRLEPVDPPAEEEASDPILAMVWWEQNNDASKIWLRVMPGGDPVLIASIEGTDDQLTPPQIEATGTDGSFVVTWSAPLPEGGRKVFALPLNITDVYATLNDDPLAEFPSPKEFTGPRPSGVSAGDLSAVMVRVAAVGEAGGFVAAWVGADDDDDAGGADQVDPDDSIYLQMFAANGNPVTIAPLRIEAPGVTSGTDGAPQLLGLGSDGFALAWMGEDAAGQWRWFVQCFTADGTPRTANDLPLVANLGLAVDLADLSPPDDFEEDSPLPIPAQLAALDNGNFVITWMVQGQDESAGVFLQRFTNQGVALGATVQLEPPRGSHGDDALPRVAALGTEGAFAVAWLDWGSSIYVQHFDANGGQAGPASQLDLNLPDGSDSEYLIFNVQIAALGDDGSYAVSWTARELSNGPWGPGPLGPGKVFVQRFNPDGSTSQDVTVEVGGDVRVSSSEPGMAYLVNADLANAFQTGRVAELTQVNSDRWNSVDIYAGHSVTELSTEGLTPGGYKLYTRDESGLWSAASEHTVTVETNTTRPSVWLDGGLGVGPLYPSDEAWFNSSEKGTAYLIRKDLTENLTQVQNLSQVLGSADPARWTSVPVTRVEEETAMPLTGLQPGVYQLYVRDRGGLWSEAADDEITVGGDPLFLGSLDDPLAHRLGIELSGVDQGDASGSAVSSAGDFNGDGFDDLLIASPGQGLGLMHIVLGGPSLQSLDLADPFNGWVLVGGSDWTATGLSVAAAGDVNGDGLADVIVGAKDAADSAGRSYVVFGRSGIGTIDLSLDFGGFVIRGGADGDRSGWGVGGGGDVNGDGLDDLIVGAPSSPNQSEAGKSYVIYGRTGTTPIQLSSDMGSQGFVIEGLDSGGFAGGSVAIAGDINGDGWADLIVGAPHSGGDDAGATVVVFGGASLTTVHATNLGAQGFVIRGTSANPITGESVAGVGDVNGDGLADLGIGVWGFADDNSYIPLATESYVVFGRTSATDIDLGNLGSQGFVIQARASAGRSNARIAAAGDLNGDGLADLLVGTGQSNGGRGTSYLVFGQSHSDAVKLEEVASCMGGFAIDGEAATDYSGASVNAAGDVDGDGLADLIIGSPGIMAPPIPTGKSHVIFGSTVSQFAQTAIDQLGGSGVDAFSDGGIAKTLVGGAGNDSLTATVASVLYGGAGDDLFVIGPAMIEALQSRMGSRGNVHQLARIDGGSGIDTLALSGSGLVLDLDQVANPAGVAPNGGSRIDGIEIIDLTGTGNNTLRLSATDVLDLVGFNAFEDTGRRQLMVKGDAGDEDDASDLGPLGDLVELIDSGWSANGSANINDISYTRWEHDTSLATLYLAPNVAFSQLVTIVLPPLELA
jgi:hypothetical protein